MVFRKEINGDSDSDSDSDSSSDSGSERVTEMMERTTLATPHVQTQRHSVHDKRACSVTPMVGTPLRAPKSHSKLISFSADSLGFSALLPSDASISALYAWSKQKISDKRVHSSPVWGNKDTVSLIIPTTNILILVHTQALASNTGSNRRLFLKNLFVGYAGEASVTRVEFAPNDTHLIPGQSEWLYIPYQGKSEIKDLRIEFENHNLATHVVVVRSAKLLDVIHKEKDPRSSTTSTSTTLSKLASSESSNEDIITDMSSLDKMKEEFIQTTHIIEESRQKSMTGGDH